jgi:hypothetical protein
MAMSDFMESSVKLSLGSGPPNKTDSRGLLGERRRVLKVENRQRTLVILKQFIIPLFMEIDRTCRGFLEPAVKGTVFYISLAMQAYPSWPGSKCDAKMR